jgi:hypothetical protein
MSKLLNLTTTIDKLSITDAIDILLHEFNLEHLAITFILTGRRYFLEEFKKAHPIKLLSSVDACMCGPIEFWGGPPFQRNYYRGNLLTCVWDAILYTHFTQGNYADLVCNESKIT